MIKATYHLFQVLFWFPEKGSTSICFWHLNLIRLDCINSKKILRSNFILLINFKFFDIVYWLSQRLVSDLNIVCTSCYLISTKKILATAEAQPVMYPKSFSLFLIMSLDL